MVGGRGAAAQIGQALKLPPAANVELKREERKDGIRAPNCALRLGVFSAHLRGLKRRFQ
jgi:hypothetical protein